MGFSRQEYWSGVPSPSPKWTLGSLIMNKGSGDEIISAELFQILNDDAVKVLHSTCQQIRKTQLWPQDWKRSVFIPVPNLSIIFGSWFFLCNYCGIQMVIFYFYKDFPFFFKFFLIKKNYTCVPHPEPSSLLPPHTIPLGRPSAPAPSIQHRAFFLRTIYSFHSLYVCFWFYIYIYML